METASSGIVKVNVDGSINNISKKGGSGIVIRDEFSWGGRPLASLYSAEHAEILACQHAISMVIAHDLMHVIVEMDAQVVVTNSIVRRPQIARCCGGFMRISGCCFSLMLFAVSVQHNANGAADSLAAYLKSLSAETYFSSLPSFALAGIAADNSTM